MAAGDLFRSGDLCTVKNNNYLEYLKKFNNNKNYPTKTKNLINKQVIPKKSVFMEQKVQK